MPVKFKDGNIWFDDNIRGQYTEIPMERLDVEDAECLGHQILLWVAERKGEMLTITEFFEQEDLEHIPPPEIKEGESYPLVRLVTQPDKATTEGWYAWLCTEGSGINSYRKKE